MRRLATIVLLCGAACESSNGNRPATDDTGAQTGDGSTTSGTSDDDDTGAATSASTTASTTASDSGDSSGGSSIAACDGAATKVPEALAEGLGCPAELVVAGEYLYVSSDGGIVRVPKTGGEFEPLEEGFFRGIQADASYVYYTDVLGEIWRRPLAGGDPESLIDGLTTPWAMQIDASYVYYMNGISQTHVGRLPIAGGEATILAQPEKGNYAMWSLTQDATHVYWASQAGGMWRVAKEGGTPELLGNSSSGRGVLGVAVDDEFMYGVESLDEDGNGMLIKVPKVGGGRIDLATGSFEAFGGWLLVDGGYVYWNDNGFPGRISRVGVDGGSCEVLVDQQQLSIGIAQDETYIYWVTQGQVCATVNGSGQVWRVAK